MKCAADFRSMARDVLRGKWAMAVVYYILGSIIGMGYSQFNLDLVDRQEQRNRGRTVKPKNFRCSLQAE